MLSSTFLYHHSLRISARFFSSLSGVFSFFGKSSPIALSFFETVPESVDADWSMIFFLIAFPIVSVLRKSPIYSYIAYSYHEYLGPSSIFA